MRLWNAQKQETEEVDDAQAGVALGARLPDGSAAFYPVREDRYPLRAPDGQLGTVPGDHLRLALTSGYELIDRQTFDHEVRKGRQEGVLPALKAAGRGLVSGLTLGLGVETDPEKLLVEAQAAEARGDSAEANRLRDAAAMHAEHPLATGAGELGGIVAPSFVPVVGEAAVGTKVGALARLLGMTPTGLVTRAGVAAGEAAVGRFAAGAAARATGDVAAGQLAGAAARASLAGSTLRWGTQGAVEGGAWMAADALPDVGEALRGDPDLDAETVMASGLMGTALGGAIGAGFPLVGAGMRAGARLLRDSTPRAVEDVARGVFGWVKDGFGDAFQAAQRIVSDVTPEQQATLRAAAKDPQLVADMLNPQRVREEATRELTDALADMETGAQVVRAARPVDDVAVLRGVVESTPIEGMVGAVREVGDEVASAARAAQDIYRREPQTAADVATELAAFYDTKEWLEAQAKGKAKRSLVSILAPVENGDQALAKLQAVTTDVEQTLEKLLDPLEFAPRDLARLRGAEAEQAASNDTQLFVRARRRRGQAPREVAEFEAPGLDDVQQAWRPRLQNLHRQLSDMLDAAGGASRPIRNRRGELIAIERTVPTGDQVNATADYHTAIDVARQALGRRVARLARDLERGRRGDFREDLYYTLNGLYNRMRGALRDQKVFGAAAEYIDALNPAWSAMLDQQRGVRKLLKQGRLLPGSFLHSVAGDEQAILDWLRRFNTPEGRDLFASLDATINQSIKFGSVISRFRSYRPEEMAAIEEAVANLGARATKIKQLLEKPQALLQPHAEIASVVRDWADVTVPRVRVLTEAADKDPPVAYRELLAVADELRDYRARLVPIIEERGRSSFDARQLHDLLGRAYSRAENVADNGGLWGTKAGDLRARLAAPGGPEAERFAAAFLAPEYRVPGELAVVRAPDPRKVFSIVTNIEAAQNSAAMESLERYLGQTERQAQAVLTLKGVKDDVRRAAESTQAAANRVREVLAAKTATLRSVAQYEAIVAAERQAVPVWSMAAGAGLGSLVGMPWIGGAMGAYASRPATAFRMQVAMARARRQFVGWAERRAASIQPGAAAAADVVRRATPRIAAAYAGQSSMRPLAPDTDVPARGAVATHAALGEHGANIAGPSSAVAMRGHQALTSALPPEGTRSPVAWAVYADRRQAVLYPAGGRASIGAMAWALPRVYPRMQAAMAWAATASAATTRGQPDSRQAAEVYLTTGVPLVAHLRPERIARMQAISAAPPAPQGAPRRPSSSSLSRRAASFRSPTERNSDE